MSRVLRLKYWVNCNCFVGLSCVIVNAPFNPPFYAMALVLKAWVGSVLSGRPTTAAAQYLGALRV